jgi:hypothetical protein
MGWHRVSGKLKRGAADPEQDTEAPAGEAAVEDPAAG